MKKLLALIMAFILTLALVGCGKQEPRRSDDGWALYYAIEYHEEHVERLPKEYAYKIEEILNGNALSEKLIDKAVAMVTNEISPITDIRSSKEYRLHVSGVMLKRGLWACKDILEGKDVEPAKLLGGIA